MSIEKVKELYKDYPEIPYISEDRDVAKFLTEVVISKGKLVPKRNMERTVENLLPGHIILLWRINFETFTTDSHFPKYFEYTYGVNGKKCLLELEKKDYIRKMTATESLIYLSVPILKNFLKEKGIRGLSKMKREDIDKAILENFSNAELENMFNIRGYEITKKGTQLLTKYAHIVDKHPKKKY